jgi:uncharacterized membrane protein HdeD (DUF308 family)
MIISGTISVLAGILFIANAGVHNPTLTYAIGYAIPGAIFFLISAVRLGHPAPRPSLTAATRARTS